MEMSCRKMLPLKPYQKVELISSIPQLQMMKRHSWMIPITQLNLKVRVNNLPLPPRNHCQTLNWTLMCLHQLQDRLHDREKHRWFKL